MTITTLPGDERPANPTEGGGRVIRMSDARRPARDHASLAAEIEATRELLDWGRSSEAETRLRQTLKAARGNEELGAQASCLLSTALEMQGRFRESLEAVQRYEPAPSRQGFGHALSVSLLVQLGLAYNYTGDHPKAITLLYSTLREPGKEEHQPAQLGALYAALARVYRHINEYTIARDNSQRALEHFRHTGDWRGLAEAYLGLGLADNCEGAYEQSLDNFGHALNLVGERPAPYLLGKIYANLAGTCWFLKRPHDGIGYLEKAISYYERTEHKANAALGYNNLGINLILVGEWQRAQEVLERALALASEFDDSNSRVPMILDSLGELHLLRGELPRAEQHLERAVQLADGNGNKWHLGQALRTLGRCHVAKGEAARALAKGQQALDLAERIGDRQAVCDSLLLLAEAHLGGEHLDQCAERLHRLAELLTDSTADLSLAGEAQRLHGLLALAHADAPLAAHHFGRSVSIFSILDDRYRAARALYGLGCAYAGFQPERATEPLSQSLRTFREMGAKLDIARAEEAIAQLETSRVEQRQENSAFAQLLTLRLAEAVASRELLLRELAAVLNQETTARRVIVAEVDEEGQSHVVAAHGCGAEEGAQIAAEMCRATARSEGDRESFAQRQDAAVIPLRPTNASPAHLYLEPRAAATLPGGLSIDSLLRVVELGMNVCALRQRVGAGQNVQEQNSYTGSGLMPGFIHSSPAMTRLVEEVHKIRSSDVTVLVTGESGTGKELVARAIHAISSRRQKVFVPFNCTAVPKELSDAYLFGYRRGSFTGAVADSPGVIRSAAGGTLFLDEIGDLPLDVQPKLLRFLQEGEIQPLGEQRPAKVDVRIIAATNTNLEEMVAAGRFREDLYYRLNVIRLRVPPLRERRSEIPAIVNYYVNHYSEKFGRAGIRITPQAVELLMVHDWPGNVRQICNEIQRVVARSEDGTLITPEQLSPELKRTASPLTSPAAPHAANQAGSPGVVQIASQHTSLADAMAELERRMITEALRKHNGNISRAARELGLTRRGLYLKLERYSLSA
ncbi:MAG: sigma 54-interacting transcriptional regulator, partial [Pyrinomonadaceae bacterium]